MTFSLKRIYFMIAVLFVSAHGVAVSAAELIMVERPGCSYCIEWKEVIGPIYPKTAEGKFAPLTVVDISEDAPFEGGYASPIIFTPTFVLVENGHEVGRLLGYTGDLFFWPLLEALLTENTQYEPAQGA